MATAKKLPSGSWRCLVYSHTDANGKRVYKSFTNDDPSSKGKRRCEADAAAWAATKERSLRTENLTVQEALAKYCELKSTVLSPATLASYKRYAEQHFGMIERQRLVDLTPSILQAWVNELSSTPVKTRAKSPDPGGTVKCLSPKTVCNVYGLMTAVLSVYAPELRFVVKLPQKIKKDLYAPTEAEVKQVIEYLAEHDKELYKAVYIAAYGTLRRSEICALTVDDVEGCVIHVRKARVVDENYKIVEKTTKTYAGQRDVVMPPDFPDLLPESGRIVDLRPHQITQRFEDCLAALGLPHFRFHDLRAHAASVMHAIGIPNKYIMQRGGWKSSATLERIYERTLKDYEDEYTTLLMKHYATRNATQKRKAPVNTEAL